MDISTTRVNITIPTAFLKEIDKYAKARYMSHSNLIRIALQEKMGLQNMIDFRPLKGNKSRNNDEDDEWDKIKKSFGL